VIVLCFIQIYLTIIRDNLFPCKMVQACEKSGYSNIIKLVPDTSEVKIRVRDAYTIQITPG